MLLDSALLQRATGCSASAAATFGPPLAAACAFHGIDTPARLAAFLAQVAHESVSLRYVAELWGPTTAQRRYEGRADLGNTQPGDGMRYRGHGLIQVTGRANHARIRDRMRGRYADVPDFEATPEALLEPKWAALSAADYWDEHGLNALADAGRFEQITRRINGGLNGQPDRLARWERARRALDAESTLPHTPPPTEATEHRQEAAMSPFLIPAIQAILEVVPQLARKYSSGTEVAERNVQAGELMVKVAKEAIGARNEQELAEALKADPQAREDVQKAIADQWYAITEAGGGGIAGARAFNAAMSESGCERLRCNPSLWVSLVLLAMPFMLLVDVFYAHPDTYDANLRTQVVTGVLMIIGMVAAYWLGTSASSQRKTDLLTPKQ